MQQASRRGCALLTGGHQCGGMGKARSFYQGWRLSKSVSVTGTLHISDSSFVLACDSVMM